MKGTRKKAARASGPVESAAATSLSQRHARAAKRQITERRQLWVACGALAFLVFVVFGFLAGRRLPYLFDGSDLVFRVPGTFAVLLSLPLAMAWYLAGRTRRPGGSASVAGAFLFSSMMAGAFYWWSGGLNRCIG